MYKSNLFFLLFTFCFALAFSQPSPSFNPIDTVFGLSSQTATQATNIPYGSADRQIFHLFLPDTVGTYPLVIFIHGGGFTGGNPGTVFKKSDRIEEVKYFLDNGIAYASVGYQVIEEFLPDSVGVIKCLNDAKRALQFIRYYANELHINPQQIGLIGTSAGAGTSVWLATHDDMAEPNSPDPISQQSTRVCAVVAGGSQSTYDIYKWETQIYQDFDGQGTNFTLDSIAEIMSFFRLSNFYGGMDSLYEMVANPDLIQYREEVDMLGHMSSDDPPLFIYSQSGAVHPSDDVLHHSLHGLELQRTAIAAGISEVKAFIPTQSIETTDGEDGMQFLLRNLTSCATATSVGSEVNGSNASVKIYPNPARGYFSVDWSNNQIEEVAVYSFTGKLMKHLEDLSTSSLTLSTTSLPAGMYIVHVQNQAGDTLSKKLRLE
ncbi:MAG: T9SS type A sorting domain-containing protein [Bacteroidota bacterium]